MHENVEVQPCLNSPTKVAMVKLFLHICLLHFLLIAFFGLKKLFDYHCPHQNAFSLELLKALC